MRGVSATALDVAASITATGNGAAVNVGDYQGIALLVLNAGATNAGTDTIKLQHSADGSTGWTDVPGGAFAAVGTAASEQSLMINADRLLKFVRVVDTLAGGATSVVRSVHLVGRKQYS
ncbi:hypothetical protein [Pseudomonas phage Persinger]|uniref:Uncharacterized protein n=1 Tax=Pseudomonas phage Persinger TaxID=2749430 RepID=A0A7D7JFS3_9CAUD|nr:hypothetical protein KB682_gp45 [Pseudomonas phage Persinger]QMP19170.1 hypothetical protein [Pseudomonas phage Persinger]